MWFQPPDPLHLFNARGLIFPEASSCPSETKSIQWGRLICKHDSKVCVITCTKLGLLVLSSSISSPLFLCSSSNVVEQVQQWMSSNMQEASHTCMKSLFHTSHGSSIGLCVQPRVDPQSVLHNFGCFGPAFSPRSMCKLPSLMHPCHAVHQAARLQFIPLIPVLTGSIPTRDTPGTCCNM